MRHILVTGGAGFIGSHLAERLCAMGERVTVLDDLSTGVAQNVPADAEFIEGDVGDAETVSRLFSGAKFDAVLHVAGQASISQSFGDPERTLRTNVMGTLNMLESCFERGVRRLLFASSMTAYGEPTAIPTSEDAACVPVSYYGVTKYAAERYVQIAGERADVDLAVTSFRMFNVYGERQSISNPYQGVLAIFIGNVLRGEPITIHSDGLQTRDFVFVDDVVDAWLRALDAPEAHGRVFNVGSGRETSISELAQAVVGACGRDDWEIRHGDAQVGDLRRSAADIAALQQALGWRPATPLEDGLRRTIAWATTTNWRF